MINEKIETINKMYYFSLVYTSFLLNTIYGFPQDNIKNYILDDELLDTASLLFSSNILFTVNESLITAYPNNIVLSNILDDELNKSLIKLFDYKNGIYYYNNKEVADGPKTIFKIRNKLAHGEYIINKNKVTIIDENNYLTFEISKINKLVYESLHNTIFENKSNRFESGIVFTKHIVSNRKEPFKNIEQVEKYIKSHKVLNATIEGMNGYKITKEDKMELDNIVNNFVNKDNFKEFKNYQKSHPNIILTYNLNDVNIDSSKLANNILQMTKDETSYFEMTKYITDSISKNLSDDKSIIIASSLNNLVIIDSIKKTKSYDINVLKDYIVNNYYDMAIDTDTVLSSIITMFNSLFMYGLTDMFDNVDNLFIPDDKLSFDLLDLAIFNGCYYTMSVGNIKEKQNVYNSLVKSIEKKKIAIVKRKEQLDNMVTKVSKEKYEEEKIKFNNILIEYRKTINEKNTLKKELDYFNNNKKYFENKAIITGIRNSIAHGNYKIKLSEKIGDTMITFDDIYLGKTTFHAEVYLVDFYNFIYNNQQIVVDYLESLKGKQLWKIYTL